MPLTTMPARPSTLWTAGRYCTACATPRPHALTRPWTAGLCSRTVLSHAAVRAGCQASSGFVVLDLWGEYPVV